MPGIAKMGALCTGHGLYPPRPNVQSSPDVLVEGLGAVRLGDLWLVHQKPGGTPNPHTSVVAAGSATVLINGIAAARIGDPLVCGSVIAEGAPTVTAGG